MNAEGITAPLTYTLTGTPAPEDIATLEHGLSAFFTAQGASPKDMPLAIFVRDDQGALVAGLDAKTGWDQMYIRTLYVAQALRGQGVGHRLLEQAEAEGRTRGCHTAWLMTSTEEAKRFYETYGYSSFGTVERHAPNCARYFMKKAL